MYVGACLRLVNYTFSGRRLSVIDYKRISNRSAPLRSDLVKHVIFARVFVKTREDDHGGERSTS